LSLLPSYPQVEQPASRAACYKNLDLCLP